MSSISPTSRTLEYLRSRGWVADIAERFLPHAGRFGKRKDLFGCIDVVALGDGHIHGVQSCGQAFSAHHRKITEDELVAPNALLWIQNGGKLWLIGWRLVKMKRGGKAMRWQPRLREYTEEDFL